MPQSSSFFKDQPMQVQSHLLSSSHVSFIPLGYIFNISLPFGTAVQVCYLNTEGTEKMGHGRGSEVSTWSLFFRKSALTADLNHPFWDLRISCLSQLFIQKAENQLGG